MEGSMKYKLGKVIFEPDDDRLWSWYHHERFILLTEEE